MQGARASYGTFEIMLPYAGIIRIRFMGMISASVSRGTPANIQLSSRAKSRDLFFNQFDLVKSWPVLAGKIDLSGL